MNLSTSKTKECINYGFKVIVVGLSVKTKELEVDSAGQKL